MSTEDAINKYSIKQYETDRKPIRKNKKPEKKVEAACLTWLHDNGFNMSVVDSGSVWGGQNRGYGVQKAPTGFSDLCGCTPMGMGCFIELKAKGKRSALRMAQREFLKLKILKGCFACVVDSADNLAEQYDGWIKARHSSVDDSIFYLMNKLPRKKSEEDGTLF